MPARRVMRRRYRRRFRKTKKVSTNVKRYVKKQIRKDSETKFYDVPKLAQNIDFVPTAYYIVSTIPQGVADSQRVGDKVTLRALRVRGTLFTGSTTNEVRIIFAQFIGNNNIGGPLPSSLLYGTYLGAANAVNAPYSNDFRNQWIILSDRKFSLNTVHSPNVELNYKVSLRYAKKTLSFVAGGINGSNHIYMMVISDDGAVPYPTINFITRLWYDDA